MIREDIYKRMVVRGVSQTDMCKELGVTLQNFNAFVRGGRSIPLASLFSVMDYLRLAFSINDDGADNVVAPKEIIRYIRLYIRRKYRFAKQFAEECGVSISTITTFINGKRDLTSTTFEKILTAMNAKIVVAAPHVVEAEKEGE